MPASSSELTGSSIHKLCARSSDFRATSFVSEKMIGLGLKTSVVVAITDSAKMMEGQVMMSSNLEARARHSLIGLCHSHAFKPISSFALLRLHAANNATEGILINGRFIFDGLIIWQRKLNEDDSMQAMRSTRTRSKTITSRDDSAEIAFGGKRVSKVSISNNRVFVIHYHYGFPLTAFQRGSRGLNGTNRGI